MHIAFYAPLKPPDHPVPSGDRRMARLLDRALVAAGHRVSLASRFRSYDGGGDPARQYRLKAEGEALAESLIAGYRQSAAAPELWFTYHLYHKAPDWLGPRVATALEIPYVVAEASHAPKRAGGPWDLGHRAAARQIAAADRVLCLTRLDMACVAPLVTPPARLLYLPPFVDDGGLAACARDAARAALRTRFALDADQPWLIAVAMMRAGDKLESYRRLAAALSRLNDRRWRLLVAGDGPARGEVEAALASLGERVAWLGTLSAEALARALAAADLCVWPAAGEAYGMALMEAQAAGLAVVAGAERGVPDVVEDGVSGLLAAPGDSAGFAAQVARLLDDAALRRRLGRQARARMRAEHSLEAAARRLGAIVAELAP